MTVIAIDIGGTKIKAALIKPDLSIIKSIRVPTRVVKGKPYIFESLDILISSLLQTKKKVTAIGFSFPGLVSDSGKILSCGNLPSTLVGLNLKNRFEKKFKLPVVIENDANCFTLAESYYGAGKNYDQILGVIWGSGVGAGYVNKNQSSIHRLLNKNKSNPFLLRGRDGGALELGEIPILVGNKYSTLEKEVGGLSLFKKHNLENVSILFDKKPLVAKQIIEKMAFGLATAVSLFNPEIIIIGGGVSNIKSKYYSKLRKRVNELVLISSQTKNLKIVRYEISDDAGVLGAAILSLKKLP